SLPLSFFHHPAPPSIYTLSLHDALPIFEFSKLGQNDYAGKEFDDLVDGKDHLVQMGLVDAKKVGITGGSYGGFASAWGATALTRSEEHTSELQSRENLVCRLLLEKKNDR